jgi:hypothetical protein
VVSTCSSMRSGAATFQIQLCAPIHDVPSDSLGS